MAERADGEVLIAHDITELDAVDVREHAFQQALRNLESDEVVIAVRGVAVLRHLRHVKAELGADVGLGRVRVGHDFAELTLAAWETQAPPRD